MGRRLDRIFSDPTLNLRDHLSLACVSRALRACYYTPHSPTLAPFVCPPSALWAGLCALRPSPEYNSGRRLVPESTAVTDEQRQAVGRIWTNGVWVDARRMQVIKTVRVGGGGGAGKKGGKKRKAEEMEQEYVQVVRSFEWVRAIKLVHALVSPARSLGRVCSVESEEKLTPSLVRGAQWIPKTDTKRLYKLTDTECVPLPPSLPSPFSHANSPRSLKSLKAQIKRNPYARKTGAPMQLFNEAAVESLALRVHGGVRAHQALYVCRVSLQSPSLSLSNSDGGDDATTRRRETDGPSHPPSPARAGSTNAPPQPPKPPRRASATGRPQAGRIRRLPRLPSPTLAK